MKRSRETEQIGVVVLVGTMCDTCETHTVSTASKQYDVPYVECSAKYGINVDLVFQTAVYEYWLQKAYFGKRS